MKFKCPICGNEEVIEDKNHKFHCSFCNKTFSKEDIASLEKENKEFHDKYYKIIENMYILDNPKYKEYVENETKIRLEEEKLKKEEEERKKKIVEEIVNNDKKADTKKVSSAKEIFKETKVYIKDKFSKFKAYLKENLF